MRRNVKDVPRGLTYSLTKAASFAKHNMRENNNNQFRPEQQDMCTDIRRNIDSWNAVLMEEVIFYDKEDGTTTCAIVDIYIENIGVCYRLNGVIHKSNRMEAHDWEQKLYLEQLGYMVIDVDTS